QPQQTQPQQSQPQQSQPYQSQHYQSQHYQSQHYQSQPYPAMTPPVPPGTWEPADRTMPVNSPQATSRLLPNQPPRPAELAPTDKRRPGENTRSVHLPAATAQPQAAGQLPYAVPIYRSPSSACSSAADYAPDGTGAIGTDPLGSHGSDN